MKLLRKRKEKTSSRSVYLWASLFIRAQINLVEAEQSWLRKELLGSDLLAWSAIMWQWWVSCGGSKLIAVCLLCEARRGLVSIRRGSGRRVEDECPSSSFSDDTSPRRRPSDGGDAIRHHVTERASQLEEPAIGEPDDFIATRADEAHRTASCLNGPGHDG